MFGLRRPYTSQEHLQKQFENQIEYITLQHNKIDNTMRDITLSVPEKEYPFFIKLIQKRFHLLIQHLLPLMELLQLVVFKPSDCQIIIQPFGLTKMVIFYI